MTDSTTKSTPKQIIEAAIEQYNPIKVVLLFSGGHDSLVSTHISATILDDLGIDYCVYHGDTTIGIPETQDFVRRVCDQYRWKLEIRKPPKKKDTYEELIKRFGFPGPNKLSHQIMYRCLKERALSAFVTYELKTNSKSRENVLLITGVRKMESKIRMGYKETISKDGSKIWATPIFYFSKSMCESYMKEHNLPRNPVKDAICISGECLCGSFGSNEELAEIRAAYPETAAKIDELHKLAKEHGHPWSWGSGPTEWYKQHPPGVIDMFTGESNPMPLCIGCEIKRR